VAGRGPARYGAWPASAAARKILQRDRLGGRFPRARASLFACRALPSFRQKSRKNNSGSPGSPRAHRRGGRGRNQLGRGLRQVSALNRGVRGHHLDPGSPTPQGLGWKPHSTEPDFGVASRRSFPSGGSGFRALVQFTAGSVLDPVTSIIGEKIVDRRMSEKEKPTGPREKFRSPIDGFRDLNKSITAPRGPNKPR